MNAKRAIDIEALLVWAYREQCVDRMLNQMIGAAAGGRTGIGMTSGQAMWTLGTRIDAASTLLTWIGAKAPDDALIVHDAVLALADRWIEIGRDADGDFVCVWSRAEVEAEGWGLAETARGWAIMRPDARELSLVRAVPVSRAVVTALVIQHARAGDQPEVHADWRPRHGGDRRSAAARLSTQRFDVIHARAMYMAWREGLAELAAALDGALAEWTVTDALPLAEPWERQAARVIEASPTIKSSRIR